MCDRDRQTNNYLEGYNRRIKVLMDKRNPSPYFFVGKLQDLGYEAIASYHSDIQRNAAPIKDKSYLSEPLTAALIKLKIGEFNELLFLKEMIFYPKKYD